MDGPPYDAITTTLGERAREAAEADEATSLSVLRTLIDAIGRRDMALLMAHASPDITLSISVPPELPFVVHARGIDDFVRAITANFDAIENHRPVFQYVVTDGDQVSVCGRETGRVRSTGLEYELEFVERFTICAGRVVNVQIVGAFAKR